MRQLIPNDPCAGNCAGLPSTTSASPTRFVRVLDGRRQPIRGLWRRGSNFYARLNVAEPDDFRRDVRIRLKASSVADAKSELARLRLERSEGAMSLQRQTPRFADHVPAYLQDARQTKRPGTVAVEEVHLRDWAKFFVDARLHQITKGSVLRFRTAKREEGWSGRSCNLALTILRNVLDHAAQHGLLKSNPLDGLRPIRWIPKRKSLVSGSDLDRLCAAAQETLTNGRSLCDYLRLMATSGARKSEALRLRWADVDWQRSRLVIGSDGLSKNHEAREVDFNPALEAHLRDMFIRRNAANEWLFPSKRGGQRHLPAKTYVESMRKARAAAGLLHVGFHDCRHHFISYAVMSGIDYMTIARWAGHKDGGVLIGRAYGHLSDEHTSADGVVTNRGAGLSNIVAISIGNGHAMALKNDGRVVPWGSVNSFGTANVPLSLSNVVAIAAGGHHALALKQDGKVVAWGGNSSGETNVPPSLSNVVAIAGGGIYSAAIVSYPARVISQPASVAVNVSSNASFGVTGAGTPPLSYQWRQDGVNLLGATNATLSLTNVQLANIGSYPVMITNISGSVTRSVAVLSVFYNVSQYLANREAGRADVIGSPNVFGLFNTNQVQDMNVGTPLLRKDPATGNFKLTIKVQRTANLVTPFTPFPMTTNSATINAQGELEFVFPSQDDAAFFRLQSR